jgi:putative transposase
MLTGIRLAAQPTSAQKLILSQWMGCARFVWNAKCQEDRYLSSYARKYLPVGTYAPIDQKYSQYKNPELSSWLSQCPSQILRNSASNWFSTYQDFLKGLCGKPKVKKKDDGGSIHLTSELFRFETSAQGVTTLFIGAKKNNIGTLMIKNHRKYAPPKSLYIRKKNGSYWVSFCYDDGFSEEGLLSQNDNLEYLKKMDLAELHAGTVGIDRGVKRPVQAGRDVFDFTLGQKARKTISERYIKRQQKKLARQQKSSKRRASTKYRIAKSYVKIANIRKDFCHKTSRSIVSNPQHKVLILEDLRTKNMTVAPKAKQDEKTGHFLPNKAKAKAGLNKAILDKGWHQFEELLKYKAYRAGKAWFKVASHYTSQECADCSHTHPNNRKSQALFSCQVCGHTANADYNAAEVIKKRAINLILDSGTELSKRGVLLDSGRGAKVRREKRNATSAMAKKRQKRQELQDTA